ncbi:DUF4132 domain-containing protein [Actinomadura sp. DC4]|uniref:DUF4132 domain-containing protein n=1 Tax=Actinomadura sp. DC4 TaxID=3055069 RepID=UPI0025AF6FD6|nr:DUF4132 domain-containing protein [Actinomadura sp. DC4]MDN3357238.1 DUF4132 domain-containing protein [Actinomadura sp. DC4]
MVETAGIPVEWRGLIHHRRGGVAAPEIALDGAAALKAREQERAARPIAEEMVRHERTLPELARAVRAWLDGTPDPAGAAAVASIAVKHVRGHDGAAFLDAWALDHGLAFAACAVTEVSSIALGRVPQPVRPGPGGVMRLVAYVNSPPEQRGEIRRMTPDDPSGANWWIAVDAVVKRLRALLAAAPEAEYRDTVMRLAAHRGDPLRRHTTCYLLPTETGWVDESFGDEFRTRILDHEHVLASLSNAAHVSRIGWIPATPAVIGTLLDGLGAEALPLLERALRYPYHSTEETLPVVLEAMVEIADERVFPLLLDNMGAKGVPAALHEAAGRHPAHAVRALAPLADDGTTKGLRAAGLLRGMLYAEPGLATALPPGDAEAFLPRPAVPDSDDLPGVLTGRPARSTKVDWADPALLPQILTRGRDRALPANATRRLLTLLAKKAPEAAAVREFCDRHSLAEFSWALFQLWYAFGAPTRHNWALAQLGLIGDDTTVRRLSPLIKIWPGESATGRAVAALDVLGEIGSDVALTHLFELTRRGKYKGLKARAVKKIDEIAAARGITPDDLADRAVPDFGLDAEGTLVLDYGPRRFTVTFDQQLLPLVVEPNGKVRKSAPKPGPKDDPALAPAAHALFTGLKKDLRTIADQEIKRLELAMITRRSWTPEDFHALFVTHPLLGHIARRLVWITDGGTSFRVAEDHTYADVDDSPFTPAPDARVGIAHPLLLDDELGAWAEILADYEILQPFDQLGRPVHRLTDDERAARRLARVEGLTLSYGKAKGHSQGRWESVDADGEFAGGWLSRRDSKGLYVVAVLSPGLYYYMYGEGEDQKITALWAGPAPASSPENAVPLGEVDPVTMSEAINDLLRSAS